MSREPISLHEIRVIKIDKMAVFDIIENIFKEIRFELFKISPKANYHKKIAFDWSYDNIKNELILYAYNTIGIRIENLVDEIKKFSITTVDSLCINKKITFYQSIQSFTTELDRTHSEEKKNSDKNHFSVRKIKNHVANHDMKDNEIRIIRLSYKAVKELLWEYFMKFGNELMNIPEESGEDIIFHMFINNCLDDLTIYAVRIDEISEKIFEMIDVYCNQNVSFTTDLITKKDEYQQCYKVIDITQMNKNTGGG